VRLTRSVEQWYTLSVEDDGVGLPAAFEPEKARCLRLRLIRALSGQLRGELFIATSGIAGDRNRQLHQQRRGGDSLPEGASTLRHCQTGHTSFPSALSRVPDYPE
jgi:hypothetical protein